MKVGKLPAGVLNDLLAKVKLDDRVIVGPKIGVDAAVIDYGDTLLVAKTDPITFATDQIGWYAVNINANDIAVMGADPKWFLATILVAPDTTEEEVERVFDQALAACKSLGVTLIGGHTEITYGLDRTIVIGCMLGETTRDRLVTAGGAKPGDVVILTKGIAIEGSAVLAREQEARLLAAGVRQDEVERARDYLTNPGISVVADASAVISVAKPTAMHDPTEGGLATGLRELAVASNVGLVIEEKDISVLPETRAICDRLELDPLGLIASGSLLLTVAAKDEEKAISAMKAAGIAAAVIGRVTPAEEGVKLIGSEGERDIPVFERDEIARLFD
ncbi:MAG: AIR synthase family protein [Armatimonadota bacterium]|nr:AIR synthase family protein [Armatimonadota bacterium]